MSNCRPAGLSDDEDDEDDFEFSTENEYNNINQTYVREISESKEDVFFTALKNKDVEAMKNLIGDGFPINEPLYDGWSPLMHVCFVGSLSLVELMIETGANVSFNKELFNPLMALSKSQSQNEDELVKCFDLLVKHGANISAIDRNASTALMYACTAGHIKLVEKLVECKCDVNIQDVEGWSALFHAVNEDREDIINVLIKGNARLDLIDRRRRSAFQLAIEKGYEHLRKQVCSKKEKLKLVQEEENSTILQKTIIDPVEEMLAELPSTKAKCSSGFSSEVSKLLFSMEVGHFSKEFSKNNVQLNELLLVTDEHLKALGVRFSVHRQRILDSLRKFHLHPWNKASLGIKPRNQQIYVEDAVRLMCNVTKHLHVLNATVNYLRIHQPVPIRPDVFKMCDSATHQLDLIRGELIALQVFASRLKCKEKLEPVDLIKYKKQSRGLFVPILAATLVIGFVLWKKNISVSLLKQLFLNTE